MRCIGWVAALAPACSFTPGTAVSTDGGEVDAVIADADVTVGWSTPVEIAELHASAGADDPSLTSDLLEIYFGSSRTGGMGREDIWVATRNSVSEPFGTPTPVTALNSSSAETTAKITALGKAIYFASDRGGGDFEIYVATRAERDQPWSTPVKVDGLSTDVDDWSAHVQPDQLRAVLCSGINETQEALWVSTRASTGDPWQPLVRLAELDEQNISECDPNEPRPGVLYYSSDYRNADGTFDVYRASRVTSTSPFGSRTTVSISAPGVNDRDPWVSADERTLVFASDRNLVNFQIYISTRL